MRILHTGDWHVGKGLQGRSRATEHESVLSGIVEVARAAKVDVSMVAGDLFDTASPPPEAERIVYATLLHLSKIGPVVLVPGNHDNAGRLDAIRDLLHLTDIHALTSLRHSPLRLEVGGETLCVAGLPWISQRHIVRAEELMALDAGEATGHFHERIKRVIATLCEPFDDSSVNVVLGHVTIAGGALGGGERAAQTIFDYWIDPNAFPASAHYVALGHLHKAQALPAGAPVHYCGAPIHLDFSDDPGAKSVAIVDALPGTPAKIETVELKAGRALQTIKGSLEDLRALEGKTGDAYLRVIVKEQHRAGLGDEIRDMFPEAVKVIVESEAAAGEERSSLERRELSPRELFERYLVERDIEDPNMVDLFQDLYEVCS